VGPTIIARNYAETLFELGRRHGGDDAVDGFGEALESVAGLLREEPRIREFLEMPRVDAEAKKRVLDQALRGRIPGLVLRFLLVVIEKRRQSLIHEIARQYAELVDVARGRIRAEVVLARDADEKLRAEIVERLEHRLGRTVLASFRVDPSLLGGIVVRAGGEVLDGSLARRYVGLRRRLMEGRVSLPAADSA